MQTLTAPVDIIYQSPGFMGVLSIDSKFQFINKTGLKWIGFKSNDEAAGQSYYDLRCKAVEGAPRFFAQDKLLLSQRKSFSFVGRYCYNNEEWKIVFGKKYLIQDETNNNSLAIVSQFDDVSNKNIIDISRFLFEQNEKFYAKDHQFSFVLSDFPAHYQFSIRESECLFFLLRGKTAKNIASILNLSHRTIEAYFEKIKDKFGCDSKEALIEKALYLGYMNFIPESLYKNFF